MVENPLKGRLAIVPKQTSLRLYRRGGGHGCSIHCQKWKKKGEKKEQLTFKSQYYTIKATRERKERGLVLGSVSGYGRGGSEGGSCGGGACAGFDVMADCRQFAAKNFHDLEGCRNISSSIDHDGLTCLACASLGESMSRGEPGWGGGVHL